MTGTPQISVVIPVWDDYARWLPSALESLGDQGVAITVIVVDNASTTAVPAAARVTMLRLDRRLSVGAARNVGLAAVSTPFVCFLDADDVLLPGALARMRARLAARPSAVVAVAGCDAWIEATGETVRWGWPRPLAYRLAAHRRLFATATALRNAYPTTGVLMRTAAMRAAGGFADADHEEDWLPAVALAARGDVDLDHRPGRRYRISGGALRGRRGPGDDARQPPKAAPGAATRPADQGVRPDDGLGARCCARRQRVRQGCSAPPRARAAHLSGRRRAPRTRRCARGRTGRGAMSAR
jgi:glycosyltransferase involved in cell wall biosynthesis